MVQGGTVTPSGLGFSSSGGTLSGVTYDGTLDLSEPGASVSLASGTVVNNAAGTGAGTINDTGDDSTLFFDNTQTFNNATINLGSTSGYSVLEEYDSTGAGTVLTLGSNVTSTRAATRRFIPANGYAGDGIVNQGNISQTASGAYLGISGNSFTNSGTITAASSGGALLTIDPPRSSTPGLSPSRTERRSPSSPLNFSNTGSITLASGASLYLNGGTAAARPRRARSPWRAAPRSISKTARSRCRAAPTTRPGRPRFPAAARRISPGLRSRASARWTSRAARSRSRIREPPPRSTQTGGTIGGAGTLTVSGAATFSGSDDQAEGAGTTLLDGATTDTGQINLDGGYVLANAGTFDVTGSAVFYLGYNEYGTTVGSGTIQNDAGGTFDFQTASAVYNGIGHERLRQRGHAGADGHHGDDRHRRGG